MRASDGERDATVRRLRTAHLAGRLDTAEFESRIAGAQRASTRADLEALLADVPTDAPDLTPTAGVPRVPGRRYFETRRLLDGTPEDVRERLLIALERRDPGLLALDGLLAHGGRPLLRR